MGASQDELDSLAEQLAAQVEYTNELLAQLQEQEQSQLHAQRDVQAKQLALRQAMAVCDSVRADQAELRKKLTIAQELASRAAADAKRWKVECDVKAKEVEGLEKFAEEARNEIDHLRGVDEQKERKLRDVEAERIRLVNQLDQYAQEESQRMAKHREGFERISRELAELKAVHHPLKNELHVFKSRTEELERSAKQRDADIKRYEEDLDRAKRRVAQLEENERHMHLLEAQFKSDLHNEQSKAHRTQQQVESAQALADARQQELDEARQQAADLSQSNRALQDEIRSLNAELETVGNDLLAQAQSRALDKERLEGRIRELQDELGRLAQEARERERAASELARAKAAEWAAQRKAGEQQYARLQDEYKQLHELLQRTQNEMEGAAQQYQIEKEELESRLAATQDRARNAEANLGRRDAEAKRESGMLLAEIQRLQNETAARSGGQVEALGLLHSTIQQLAAECQELQEGYNSAVNELDNMRADAANHKRLGAVAIQDWHTDTKRALADLAEANNRTRLDFERTRDAQLAAEVQRDEERAKNLMLEEERRRLEDEVQYLKQSVRALEEASRERLENARLEFESAASEQDDLSRRTMQLSEQLEETNAQNRSLQEERQRAASALADVQARMGQRVASLEKQLDESEEKLRKVLTERDSFEADRELMRRAVQDASVTIKSLQSQISTLEAQQRDVFDREKKHTKSYDSQMSTLRESVRKYQAQLTQTKSLLKVVQDQRKHLQEDNMSLRSELDEVLRRSLTDSMQGSGVGNGLPGAVAPAMMPQSNGYARAPAVHDGAVDIPSYHPQSHGEMPNPALATISSWKSPAASPERKRVDVHHHEYEPSPGRGQPGFEPEDREGFAPHTVEAAGASPNGTGGAGSPLASNNPLHLDIDKLRREVEELKSESGSRMAQ